MLPTQLHSIFLVDIWVSICVLSVVCNDGNGILEKSLFSYDQNLRKTTEILRTKRAIPRRTTPKANDVLLIYACEHNKKKVECDPNSVIHVLKASYGRTSLTTCDQNPDGKWSVKCMNKEKTEKIVSKRCNGKQSCDVPATNSVFGDPCFGTIKYLEVKYLCAPDNEPISTHVCEHSTLHMKCDAGKVIHLLEANYGRTTLAKCTSYNLNWNLNCVSRNSEEIIRKKCDQKRACDVEAYNSIFGDPCPGTIKYIEMQYYCAPDEHEINTHATSISNNEINTSETATLKDENISILACEGDNLHAECEKGNVIQLLQANYGRTSLAKCDKNYQVQPNVKCVNNKTEEIVRKICNGKRTCKIRATNSVFGDPCPGIIKNLEMQYLCVPDEVGTTIPNTESTTSEAENYQISKTISTYACEDNNVHLKCKEGNGIRTLQANYGRTTLSKCYEKRAKPWSVNCLNNKTEEIVRKMCDGKRNCNISATNSVFGDPCHGTIKYLELQYLCVSDGVTTTTSNSERDTPEETTQHEPISIHVCEDANLHMDCDKGKVIHLLKANYGRTTLAKCNEKYYKEWSVNCMTYNTGEIVRKKCDGKSDCDVTASNYVFGDPCFGTVKYLEVQYLCAPENKAISVHVCENDILHAKCDSGRVFQLLQANYGRTTLAKCNLKNNVNWNVNCVSYNSEQIVREICNGKRRCDVAASNSVFGDPCYGTIKYLEIQYLCVPDEETTTILNIEKNTPEKTTYQETIAISEETGILSSNSLILGKTNTIDHTATESPKRVSSTTQDIPKPITDVSKTESVNPKIDTTDPTTTSDIPILATDHPRTISTIPRTITDYPRTETAYPKTESAYYRTDFSILATAPENSRTVADIRSVISEIPKTLANITSEAFKYVTAVLSEETNVPTMESSAIKSAASHFTECSNYNLTCFNFKCPTDFGSYLHPANSRKMYIVCINWNPTVKECGKGLVLSEKLMKCVAENQWWSRWSGYSP